MVFSALPEWIEAYKVLAYGHSPSRLRKLVPSELVKALIAGLVQKKCAHNGVGWEELRSSLQVCFRSVFVFTRNTYNFYVRTGKAQPSRHMLQCLTDGDAPCTIK